MVERKGEERVRLEDFFMKWARAAVPECGDKKEAVYQVMLKTIQEDYRSLTRSEQDARHVPGVRCPIQQDHLHDVPGMKIHEVFTIEEGWVPWIVAEVAYQTYARDGHGNQSLERLAQRGGFGWGELIACLRGSYNNPDTTWADLRAAIERRKKP